MLAKEAKSYKYRPARLTTTEDLWQIKPTSVKGHQAPFPEELVENCMLPSTDEGDWVLDPFAGSGTTLLVANNHRRNAIGIDIDPRNVSIVQERLDDVHMEIRHDNSSIISSA